MKNYLQSVILFLIPFAAIAQITVDQNVYEVTSKVENVLSFIDGNFLVQEKTRNGNKFTWFNENLEPDQQLEISEKLDYEDLYFLSHTGKNIIEKTRKKDHYLINKERSFLSDENLNGEISDLFYYRSDVLVDVVLREFLTDQYFISISRKEGKENFEDGDYSKIKIFLFRKNLKTEESEYFPLEIPENANFNSRWPKLLYHTNSYFILTAIESTGDSERTYINTKYDYSGKILSTHKNKIEVLEPDDEFAIVNYSAGAFMSTPSGKYGSVTQKNIVNYQFATSLAKGYLEYDPFDNSYYLFAAVKPKKGDSGMLVYKYDDSGNLKWKQYYTLPNTNLKYLNSYNRHITFDVSDDFIGFNIYSTKGTNYCDFYAVDKVTGALKNSHQFRKYDIEKNGKRYNNIYSPYNLKDKGLQNLILDSKMVYAALYYPEIMNYLKEINSEGKTAIKSSYIKDGIIVSRSQKNDDTIVFERILF